MRNKNFATFHLAFLGSPEKQLSFLFLHLVLISCWKVKRKKLNKKSLLRPRQDIANPATMATDLAGKSVVLFDKHPVDRMFFRLEKAVNLHPEDQALAIRAVLNPDLLDLQYRLKEMQYEDEDEEKVQENVFAVLIDPGKTKKSPKCVNLPGASFYALYFRKTDWRERGKPRCGCDQPGVQSTPV
jgi:hypothetical protein